MIFNADGSNRHKDLRHRNRKISADRLSGFLYRKIQEYHKRAISIPTAADSAQGDPNTVVEDMPAYMGALSLAAANENPMQAIPASSSRVSSPPGSNPSHTPLTPSSSSTASLPSSVAPSLSDAFNGLLTVSEFFKMAYNDLKIKLNESEKYEGILSQVSKRDYLASYWNANKWQKKRDLTLPYGYNRYSAVVLEEKATNKRLLYVSVHLRHRGATKEIKKKEIKILKTVIEDNKKEEGINADAWIIAGDFNLNRSDVVREFGSDVTSAVSDDEYTTANCSSIDNILMSDAIELHKESHNLIDRIEYRLTHYPLYGILRFKDE